MKDCPQTLEFPIHISQSELIAYQLLVASNGKPKAAAAFMAAKGLTCRLVADKMGVHYTRPSQILREKRASEQTIGKLLAIGFPRIVLPDSSGKAA